LRGRALFVVGWRYRGGAVVVTLVVVAVVCREV
jgi:hypothetical protein